MVCASVSRKLLVRVEHRNCANASATARRFPLATQFIIILEFRLNSSWVMALFISPRDNRVRSQPLNYLQGAGLAHYRNPFALSSVAGKLLLWIARIKTYFCLLLHIYHPKLVIKGNFNNKELTNDPGEIYQLISTIREYFIFIWKRLNTLSGGMKKETNAKLSLYLIWNR